ncbi:MAG: hypothetical protein QXG65_05695 [Thermoplasmata archaeon]
MPSLGVARTRWPVAAWIRLRLPPAPPPVALAGLPPPPDPPLDLLERNPVPTDPRRRVWAFEEERPGPEGPWVLRLVWDEEDPGALEAELRSPVLGVRPAEPLLRAFWQAVRERTTPIGPLPIDGADPWPSSGGSG